MCLFAEGEIDELWITFPDPQLKTRRAKKRLTSPLFLEYYARLLRPDGMINLKTDSKHLYAYTNEVIRQIPSEEMLEIAKALDRLQGLLVKQKA